MLKKLRLNSFMKKVSIGGLYFRPERVKLRVKKNTRIK